jgi:hypothetical protein
MKTEQGNKGDQYSEICKEWLMKHEDDTSEPEYSWHAELLCFFL